MNFVCLVFFSEQVIWSGLKLGPPRKEKFPSDEKLEELAATFFSD